MARRQPAPLEREPRRPRASVFGNPPTFEIEICGSYDKAKVCEVLHAVGWLLKAENGRWQHQRKRNGTKSRYYVLINEAPPETEE